MLFPGDTPRTPRAARSLWRAGVCWPGSEGRPRCLPGEGPPDPRGGFSCSLAARQFRGGPRCFSRGTPPDPRGGFSCSLAAGQFRGGPRCFSRGTPPGPPAWTTRGWWAGVGRPGSVRAWPSARAPPAWPRPQGGGGGRKGASPPSGGARTGTCGWRRDGPVAGAVAIGPGTPAPVPPAGAGVVSPQACPGENWRPGF